MTPGNGSARGEPPDADPSTRSRGTIQPEEPPHDAGEFTILPEDSPPGASLEPSPSTMLSTTLTICNKKGLHARAAARFVTLAERFGASVDVVKDGQAVSARSIMGLMMLGAGMGSTIELRAEGWDAKEALEALASLVDSGFHEQD